jgi:hypothetical protein
VSDSEQDDEFEAYLKRRIPVDKGVGPIDPLEPPPELDRLVIGKARKAIQSPTSLSLYRAPKWALPVGLAATILLSFAILLDLGVRAKRNDASLQATAGRSLDAPAAPAPLPKADPHLAASTAVAAPPPVTPAANAPMTAVDQEVSADSTRTRLAKAEKAAKRARPEQEMANRASVEDITVTAQRKTAEYASEAAPRSAPPRTDAVQATAPAAGLPAAPPTGQSTAGDPANEAAASSTVSSVGPADSKGETKAVSSDPAAWLTRIEKLRATGQTAEAEREMKRFRAAYPDYPAKAP